MKSFLDFERRFPLLPRWIPQIFSGKTDPIEVRVSDLNLHPSAFY